MNKSKKKKHIKWRKLIITLFVIAVVYSFLPMIPFWLIDGAPASDNNVANVQKISGNEGSYFSFIVFGDNHAGLVFNDAATVKEIWHMNREDRFRKSPIDFVMSVGDVTLDGSRKHYLASKKIQKMIKFPFITAIGNHDERKLFEEFYGEVDFTFVNRNSYFIVFDNEDGQPSEEQFKWLEDKLKEGQKHQNIFITMHKPPFDPYQQDWYNEDNSPWTYRFRKLCAEYDVDMVFSGHKHLFKAAEFDGVTNIVTGGGGMILEIPESEGGYLHYVKVAVNNDYITYEVRKVSPPLWEYVTYYMWKEMVYWVRNFYGSGYLFKRNTTHKPLRETKVNDKEYWIWE